MTVMVRFYGFSFSGIYTEGAFCIHTLGICMYVHTNIYVYLNAYMPRRVEGKFALYINFRTKK